MKRFFSVICFLVASNAFAGTQSGFVEYVSVRASDGVIVFKLTGTKENSPACATIDYWLIKDENSIAGQQQYSMILAAQAAKKTVRIEGMNTCTRWGDGEDVDTMYITNL